MPEDLPTPKKSLKQLEKENNFALKKLENKSWSLQTQTSAFEALFPRFSFSAKDQTNGKRNICNQYQTNDIDYPADAKACIGNADSKDE